MLMLLEAWDGITLSRNVAFSKQKMTIENRPHDPKTYQFPRPPDTWNVLKHKAWWISALAIVAGVNIVLLIYIYFFVKSWDMRDALTVLLFLFDFGFAAVLSTIPIGIFCYKQQQSSEIKR